MWKEPREKEYFKKPISVFSIQVEPYLILEDGQYIFIGNYKDPVRHDETCEIEDNSFQIILPIESILDKNYFVNSKGVIEYRKPYCTKCNSRNIIKKDSNFKELFLEPGVPIKVKVNRYYCKKCNIAHVFFWPNAFSNSICKGDTFFKEYFYNTNEFHKIGPNNIFEVEKILIFSLWLSNNAKFGIQCNLYPKGLGLIQNIPTSILQSSRSMFGDKEHFLSKPWWTVRY